MSEDIWLVPLAWKMFTFSLEKCSLFHWVHERHPSFIVAVKFYFYKGCWTSGILWKFSKYLLSYVKRTSEHAKINRIGACPGGALNLISAHLWLTLNVNLGRTLQLNGFWKLGHLVRTMKILATHLFPGLSY